MGLIYCSDCGKQISEYADKCNNCGYPLQPKQQVIYHTTVNSNTNWIVFGYIFPFLAIIFHPFFALIGIVFGIINISKRSIAHGIIQIILSLIFGVIATALNLFMFLFLL